MDYLVLIVSNVSVHFVQWDKAEPMHSHHSDQETYRSPTFSSHNHISIRDLTGSSKLAYVTYLHIFTTFQRDKCEREKEGE